MRIGLKCVTSALAIGAAAAAVGLAPPAAADTPNLPGITEVHPPARHQTRGGLEITVLLSSSFHAYIPISPTRASTTTDTTTTDRRASA